MRSIQIVAPDHSGMAMDVDVIRSALRGSDVARGTRAKREQYSKAYDAVAKEKEFYENIYPWTYYSFQAGWAS